MQEHNKSQCSFETGKRHCWSDKCFSHISVPDYFCSSECQNEYWSGAEGKKKVKTIKEVIALVNAKVVNPLPLERTLSDDQIEEIFSQESEETESAFLPERLFPQY